LCERSSQGAYVCEAVYAPVIVGGRRGYQIAVRPSDLDKKDEIFIDLNGIPLGINPSDFSKGKRFLVLPSGRIAINILYNVGESYDKRMGAIYSYFLLLNKDNYERFELSPIKLNGCLQKVGDEKKAREEYLKIMEMKNVITSECSTRGVSEISGIDFDAIKSMVDEATLAEVIKIILNYNSNKLESSGQKKRIIFNIEENNYNVDSLIKFYDNLLLLLPAPLNIITYTTYVADPDRESAFQLMASINGKFKYPKTFFYIFELPAVGGKSKEENTVYNYIAKSVFKGDTKAILDLHEKYHSVSKNCKEDPFYLFDTVYNVYFLLEKIEDKKDKCSIARSYINSNICKNIKEYLFELIFKSPPTDIKNMESTEKCYADVMSSYIKYLYDNKTNNYLEIFKQILEKFLHAKESSNDFVRKTLSKIPDKGKDIYYSIAEVYFDSPVAKNDLLDLLNTNEQVEAFVEKIKEEINEKREYKVVIPVANYLQSKGFKKEADEFIKWCSKEKSQIPQCLKDDASSGSNSWAAKRIFELIKKDIPKASKKPLIGGLVSLLTGIAILTYSILLLPKLKANIFSSFLNISFTINITPPVLFSLWEIVFVILVIVSSILFIYFIYTIRNQQFSDQDTIIVNALSALKDYAINKGINEKWVEEIDKYLPSESNAQNAS